MPERTWVLRERDALAALDAVVEEARRRHLNVVVTVVDGAGQLLGLRRMDGTKAPAVHVASGKAWTAAMFQRPSADYQGAVSPGGDSFGLWNAFPGYFIPLDGGLPLFVQGVCVGGVGVSGGTGADDRDLAEVAASLISSDLLQES